MAQAVLCGAKVRPFFFGGLGATNVGEVSTVILGQTRTTATWGSFARDAPEILRNFGGGGLTVTEAVCG